MRRVPQPYRNGELVIVIDCSELDRSARFWAGVLGYAAGAAAGGHYRSLMPETGEGIEVLLQQVADEKHGKNRLHLDLRTADLVAEASRIPSASAHRCSPAARCRRTAGGGNVLADPDGNEFCVLQPPAGPATT